MMKTVDKLYVQTVTAFFLSVCAVEMYYMQVYSTAC